MPADLRGFEYALEPLRTRQQWRVDGLLGELGSLQKRIFQAEARLDRLGTQYDEQSRAAADAAKMRLDVSAHRQGLQWLTALHGQIEEERVKLQALLRERAEVQGAYVVQQQKLDAMHQHRGDCIADYKLEQSRRASAQADQDWIMRQGKPVLGADV